MLGREVVERYPLLRQQVLYLLLSDVVDGIVLSPQLTSQNKNKLTVSPVSFCIWKGRHHFVLSLSIFGQPKIKRLNATCRLQINNIFRAWKVRFLELPILHDQLTDSHKPMVYPKEGTNKSGPSISATNRRLGTETPCVCPCWTAFHSNVSRLLVS